jgi:hypothetical protein
MFIHSQTTCAKVGSTWLGQDGDKVAMALLYLCALRSQPNVLPSAAAQLASSPRQLGLRAYSSQPRWRRSLQQQRSRLDAKLQAMLTRRRRNVENGLKRYTLLRAQFEPRQPSSPTARWNKLLAGNGHDIVVQAALRHHYSDLHSRPQAVGTPPSQHELEEAKATPSRLEQQLANETLWTVPNLLTISRMIMTPFIGKVSGAG